MPLKSARQYYAGPEMTISPLWRRIATTFQRQFLVQVGDSAYADGRFYVRDRNREATAELGAAIDEHDVVEYLEGPSKRLAVVVAPAGLGKTTFVRHATAPFLTRPGFAVVWLDLLRDLPLPDVARVDVQVAALISAGLGRVLADAQSSSASWQTFFLERCSDTSGVARMLLEEWQSNGELRPASQDSLQYLMRAAESDLAELIRLRFAYLRSVLKRTPVVVIDNVDQLPALALEAISRLGFALAEGPNTVARADADFAWAKVILAMRPVGATIAQRAVGTALRGVLSPPDIAQVIRRRLQEFLDAYERKRKILPEGAVPVGAGQTVPVNELVDAAPGDPLERSTRELLERTIDVLFSETHRYGQLAHLVLKLNNYNTRVSLLATAGFVASGHLDWLGIFRAMHHDRNLGAYLSWPKLLRAMFLGVRTTFGSESADWLWNMFNDGEPDRLSAVIRPRMLKVLSSKSDGLSLQRLVEVLGRLFGYPAERVAEVAREARDRGVVHEKVAEQLALTGAGLTYLKRMSSEFEYLQHVVVDAWVDNDHLVKCTTADEPPSLRCERVLQFADYVREIEVRDYVRVIRDDSEDLYDRYFGEDTLSASLCASLLDADRLAGAMGADQWTRLVDRARELQARSAYACIREAALDQLKTRGRLDAQDHGPSASTSATWPSIR